MVTLFSVLVWEIPWTEEPGGLQSMGLQRVKHNLASEQQQQQQQQHLVCLYYEVIEEYCL